MSSATRTSLLWAACVWAAGCASNPSPVADAHVHVAMRFAQGDAAAVVTGAEGGQLDVPRARTGGLRFAFSAALAGSWESEPATVLVARQLALIERVAAAQPRELRIVRSSAETAGPGPALKLVHAVENGLDLGEDLAELDLWSRAGVRLVSLVHSASNNIGDAAADAPRWRGLSPLGERAVARANDLGLWLDVSHASPATIEEMAALSRAPLIASHTAAHALLADNPNNLKDASLRHVAATGGLVCLFFGSEAYLPGYQAAARRVKSEVVADLRARGIDLASRQAEVIAEREFAARLPRAGLDVLVAHARHIKDLIGARHLCIGSDFDGIGPTAVRGLDDASRYPTLLAALRAGGFSAREVEGIAGGNLLRTWRAVEQRAGAEQ